MFTVGLLLAFLTHRIAYWRNKYAMYVFSWHYSDVIISAMVSQLTGISIVYSIVCSGADNIKHQSSASLTFVREIHRWPVNSPHKGPVKRKCFHLMMSSWYTIHRCWNWTAYQTIELAMDSTLIVARLKEPRDHNVGILENKSTLLTISRLWRYCGPSNYRFNFLLYWYAPWVFFEVVNVLSCSPFMFENTENKQLGWRIRHSQLASTLFHSLVPWWRPRRIRPQISRLSQLENSAMGTWPIYKNSIIPDWFEKWRDMNSDTGVNCVVPQNYDVCPLLMMHKTCLINYGHLADLQKNTSYIELILTKKTQKTTFYLIKYLLATFIFFLSFQSVLVSNWIWIWEGCTFHIITLL